MQIKKGNFLIFTFLILWMLLSSYAFAVTNFLQVSFPQHKTYSIGTILKAKLEIFPYDENVKSFFLDHQGEVLNNFLYILSVDSFSSSANNINVGLGAIKMILLEGIGEVQNSKIEIAGNSYFLSFDKLIEEPNLYDGSLIAFSKKKVRRELSNYYGYLIFFTIIFVSLLFVKIRTIKKIKKYQQEKIKFVNMLLNKKNKEEFEALLPMRKWFDSHYPGKRIFIEMMYNELKDLLYKESFDVKDGDKIINYLKKIV